MLSYLDPILFPDQCEILEVGPDRYVYPIFKNGSSSLLAANPRKLNYFEMRELRTVEVFLREPFERYVSGVQTYLRQNTHLDRATALTMIDEYLFLNSHFSLQFHWIVNLQKFTDAWMYFRPIEELHTATDHTWNVLARDETLVNYFGNNKKLNYYLQLDKILYEDFMGQTVSLKQIIRFIQTNHHDLYNEVIDRSIQICNVLD
jgi:hypothetical protein